MMGTRNRFEKEAKGNSEMAYYLNYLRKTAQQLLLPIAMQHSAKLIASIVEIQIYCGLDSFSTHCKPKMTIQYSHNKCTNAVDVLHSAFLFLQVSFMT